MSLWPFLFLLLCSFDRDTLIQSIFSSQSFITQNPSSSLSINIILFNIKMNLKYQQKLSKYRYFTTIKLIIQKNVLNGDIIKIFAFFIYVSLLIFASYYYTNNYICIYIFNTLLNRDMINEDILNDLNDLQSIQQDQIQQDNLIDDLMDDDQLPLIKQSQFQSDQKFKEHMKKINNLIDKKIESEGSLSMAENQHNLIIKSNQYASSINKEINSIFRYVKGVYNRKFPQLESIITKPPLYCKAVRQIQMFQIGLSKESQKQSLPFNYLSNHQKISLQIALSTIHDKLPSEETKKLLESTETVVLLHQHHNVLMMYLESCMQLIAPNLCQLVGSLIASRLISIAGGIKELAAIPACNIQVMGGNRSAQVGLGMIERNHTGVFGSMDLVKDAPQDYQMQLVRMLASNTAKCARADSLKSQKGLGARLRQDMYDRYEKIQEQGGLNRIDRPLPIPDQQPKKKRGGKRYRKNKQLYELSQVRKQQNRLKFGLQAQEQIQDGVGLGMLSQGMGKLKVNIKKQKLNVSKKMTERINKKSGASQGIELINPLRNTQPENGKQTIFSKSSGFQTVLNNKFGSFK